MISSKPFKDVAGNLGMAIGHPDMGAFRSEIASAKTHAVPERVVESAPGP